MTKYETLSLLLGSLQASAIIITLYGVIRQLKQFNANMEYDAYSKHIDDNTRITELLIHHPSLNEVLYTNNPEYNALTAAERDFYNYIAITIGCMERLYVLRKKGWTDDRTYQCWERWFIEQWFPLKVFNLFWEREGRYYNTEFHDSMTELYDRHKAKNRSDNSKGFEGTA